MIHELDFSEERQSCGLLNQNRLSSEDVCCTVFNLCRNHLGAGTVGLIFGLLTCPTVQINVHVEEPMGENPTDDTMESYLLLNEGLHPTRLLLVFALSLGVFFALYSVGVPVATEFHFLHGGLGDENW